MLDLKARERLSKGRIIFTFKDGSKGPPLPIDHDNWSRLVHALQGYHAGALSWFEWLSPDGETVYGVNLDDLRSYEIDYSPPVVIDQDTVELTIHLLENLGEVGVVGTSGQMDCALVVAHMLKEWSESQ